MKESLRNEIGQIYRYLVANLPSLAVFYAVYITALWGGISYIAATWLAFGCSMVANFLLQKFFAFREMNMKRTGKEAVFFVSLSVIWKFIATYILFLLVEYTLLNPIEAQVAITVGTPIIGYPVLRWIFRSQI